MHNGPTDSIPVEPVPTRYFAESPSGLSVILPEGWSQRLVNDRRDAEPRVFIEFRNANLNAVAFLDLKRSALSPYEEAQTERAAMLRLRRHCRPVQMRLHPHGIVSDFTVGGRRSTGKIAIVRMHQDRELLTRVYGAWPASADAEASGDFDYIVNGLKPN